MDRPARSAIWPTNNSPATARVNWLLARAQAEEIRTSPAYQHWFTQDRFVAGRGWLEEATLMAQSEPARLRAFQELAARLTVDERLAAAGQILDQAARRCTSAASTTALAQWRTALGGLEQGFQTRHAQQELDARNAYVQELRSATRGPWRRATTQPPPATNELLTAAGAGEQ